MIKFLTLTFESLRVKTLPISLIPIIMASSLVFYHTKHLDVKIFWLTMFSALFIQIAVNFFNESEDFSKKQISNLRKGPLRPVQRGEMSFSQIQILGFLSCFIAILLGIPLVLKGGWPILFIGLSACLMSYFYTSSRWSLLRKGFSEIFCFLFFGPVASLGTYYLQTLKWNSLALYLGLQCGFWAVSLLLINHLRDEKEDQAKGRKHFVTMYGRINTLFFLCLGQAFIYLMCFFWLGQNLNSGAWTFFILPLSAIWLSLVCMQPPSQKYNSYLALGSGIYLLFGLVWAGALL